MRRLRWKGPVFRISGLAREGTEALCQAVMTRLEEIARDDGGARSFSSLLKRKSRALPGFSSESDLRQAASKPLVRTHFLDARVQVALVPRCLVAVDDALVDHRVDDRARGLELGSCLFLVARVNGAA